MRVAMLLVLAVVVVPMGVLGSDLSEHEIDFLVALADAPSFVPECEKYIHIGGGFFCTFDTQRGVLAAPGAGEDGALQFRLDGLRWESTYVYLPEGECNVRLPGGCVSELRMECLDYVEDPRTGRPLYRLVAAGAGMRVVLIADSPDPDNSSGPHLEGFLLVAQNTGRTVVGLRMRGRNECEAERHLNRVVYVRSDFSNADL